MIYDMYIYIYICITYGTHIYIYIPLSKHMAFGEIWWNLRLLEMIPGNSSGDVK